MATSLHVEGSTGTAGGCRATPLHVEARTGTAGQRYCMQKIVQCTIGVIIIGVILQVLKHL